MALVFGGLLPIVAFTVIEDKYGVVAGIIAGLVFGLGEIAYEKIKHNKVSALTWTGNGMLLGLGAVSLISEDGIWFKLQPALIEFFFALFLWGSVILKKNFLLLMMEKQNPNLPELLKKSMNAVTVRLGFFFFLQSGLATWAAFKWSTESWALLKGVGVTLSMIAYMILEMTWLVFKMRKQARSEFTDSN